MRDIEILPTCVPTGADDIERAARLAQSLRTSLHLDIDDGIFAPTVTWPYVMAGEFEPFSLPAAPQEVHLMVEGPRSIGLEFVRAGVPRIVAHIEAFADSDEAHGTLDLWRDAGAKEVGLALLFDTPTSLVEPLLPACDVVHFMSIATIGTQGIPFEPSAPARIAEFHAAHPGVLLSVDGGVSASNIAALARAGARRFGVGSFIAKAADPSEAYRALKEAAQNALQ